MGNDIRGRSALSKKYQPYYEMVSRSMDMTAVTSPMSHIFCGYAILPTVECPSRPQHLRSHPRPTSANCHITHLILTTDIDTYTHTASMNTTDANITGCQHAQSAVLASVRGLNVHPTSVLSSCWARRAAQRSQRAVGGAASRLSRALRPAAACDARAAARSWLAAWEKFQFQFNR